MQPTSRRRPSRRASVLALASVLAIVAACAPGPSPAPTRVPEASVAPPATSAPSAGPSIAGSAAAAATPVAPPAPVLPLPPADSGDPSETAILLQNQDGRYDAYRGIGRFDGSSTCTATLIDTATGDAARTAPAWVLTNGHCVGLWDMNEVIVGQEPPASPTTVTFDWFVDATDPEPVTATAISWATMKGTDLALVRLDTTLGALADRGIRPFPLASTVPAPGTAIVNVAAPVGVPIVDIPQEERFLRLGTCTVEGDPVGLVERQWRWWAAIRNDCPDVWPGSSGSPMLDLSTGELVGAIDTTTIGSAGGADCWLGRPCEVSADGVVVREDTSYAMPVAGIADCFAPDGSFAVGGSCPLDPGIAPTVSPFVGAVNPTLAPSPGSRPPRTTWGVAVESATLPLYRYRIGPVGTTDCRDGAGYGAAVAIADAPLIDAPLPTEEGIWIACVIGMPAEGSTGGTAQEPRFASVSMAFIDLTAPTATIEWSVRTSPEHGWQVEPIFAPPELSAYDLKYGPRASTDCAEPDGYAPYRRIPIDVPASDAPAIVCAVGYDDAGNASQPAELLLPEDAPAP